MDSRVAVISIIVEDGDAVTELNSLLHDYSQYISIICLAIDAPNDRINALTGALGRIKGLRAKATYSAV